MLYLLLKSLHVVSVVLFLGNIITGVFWKRHGDRGDLAARRTALSGLIAADRIFTMPAVLAIVATGIGNALIAHIPILGTPWILWSIVLFGVSGAVFAAKVGPLQKKLLANVDAGLSGTWDESAYRELSRGWLWWGWVATGAPLIAVFLMVFKPTF
ncbi:MAG TPA: DUF2269 family protein [Steroidobacteraceae bacterium]|nr:DUF2269 family protein [Steroidobacteraceae bacterium]